MAHGAPPAICKDGPADDAPSDWYYRVGFAQGKAGETHVQTRGMDWPMARKHTTTIPQPITKAITGLKRLSDGCLSLTSADGSSVGTDCVGRSSISGRSPHFRFIDLFAGIGGIRLALERVGGKCVFSSEWDSAAVATYSAYFGQSPAGDITKVLSSAIPQHEVLAGGFPCQAFSIMGGMRGFGDTRGTLFFEIERILRAREPAAFLLENVKNLVSHDGGNTFRVILDHLKGLGYHVQWRVLNALDYNLPQKRERVIIVGFRHQCAFEWPCRQVLSRHLADVLEPDADVNAKHFASESVRRSVEARLKGKVLPGEPWICHENKSGNISPLPYSCALRAGASYNYLLVNGRRRLTPREQLRLQGFPEDFPIVVGDSAVRKQCGNSVPVPMIEAVARQLVEAICTVPIAVTTPSPFPTCAGTTRRSGG